MSFNRQNYRFLTGELHCKNIIFVYFPYNPLLKNELREKFPTARLRISAISRRVFRWYPATLVAFRLPERT